MPREPRRRCRVLLQPEGRRHARTAALDLLGPAPRPDRHAHTARRSPSSLPFVFTKPSQHLVYAAIAAFAICALSLTVLTGWAGQLSLGQMAFAGLGALMGAALTRGLEIDWIFYIRFDRSRSRWRSCIAAVFVAGVAALIGAGALRVTGLLLAVSTFAFAVTAAAWIYQLDVLTPGQTRRCSRGVRSSVSTSRTSAPTTTSSSPSLPCSSRCSAACGGARVGPRHARRAGQRDDGGGLHRSSGDRRSCARSRCRGPSPGSAAACSPASPSGCRSPTPGTPSQVRCCSCR